MRYKNMRIDILYDNQIYKARNGLKNAWGFSCLIKDKKNTILFDTGGEGSILLNNMEKLNVNPKDIEKIVISHEHWDHNGGLKDLIDFLEDIEIYRIADEKPNDRLHLNIVEEEQSLTDRIYTTGRLKGYPVDEQSLVINGKKGFYVITGCSHSGVNNIIKKTEEYGRISGIIGGLHGFKNFHILKDLDLICATHCTKYKDKINKIYPSTSIEGGVGKIIKI